MLSLRLEVCTQKGLAMRKKIDIKGQRFGRLVVVEQAGNSTNGKPIPWLCMCDCGNEKIIISSSLRYGKTRSCGCLKDEKTSKRSRKYPRGYEGLKDVRRQMIARCTELDHPDYGWYGARGISVCSEWVDGLGAFIQWAKTTGYRKGLSIDRIDNDGNYCPENCRWASDREQANNRSNNHIIKYKGKEYTIAEAARKYNIKHSTLTGRLKRGWSVEKSIEEPIWIGRNQND